MNRSAKYSTAIVVAHLLLNIVHGLAHRELHVGLAPLASIFVIVVVLVFPLIAMGLLWTAKKRLGLILLSFSMFGSLLFGLYYHFLAVSRDHIHSQTSGGWGITFVLTAYLLLITEAIGTYVGIHFLWILYSVLYFGPSSLPKISEVKEADMPKVVNCKDAGVECDFVIRGETAEDILRQAAEHARTAHNMTEIPPEVAQKLRGAIRDEAA